MWTASQMDRKNYACLFCRCLSFIVLLSLRFPPFLLFPCLLLSPIPLSLPLASISLPNTNHSSASASAKSITESSPPVKVPFIKFMADFVSDPVRSRAAVERCHKNWLMETQIKKMYIKITTVACEFTWQLPRPSFFTFFLNVFVFSYNINWIHRHSYFPLIFLFFVYICARACVCVRTFANASAFVFQ